jgi:hypothetical protein
MVLAFACVLALGLGALGCREEGPGERLGRAFDEAANDIAEAVEDEVDSAMEAAGEAAEAASDRVKKEVDDASEKAHEAIDKAAEGTRS